MILDTLRALAPALLVAAVPLGCSAAPPARPAARGEVLPTAAPAATLADAGSGDAEPEVPAAPARERALLSPECRELHRRMENTVDNTYVNPSPEDLARRLTSIAERAERLGCAGWLRARAWMYIGLARGAEPGRIDDAKTAFARAMAADPEVEIDRSLATPGALTAFAEVRATRARASEDRK